MPRTIQVEIIGDASSLERSFKRASSSGKTFEKEISQSARGAIVATGAFRSLGRSIAFAGGAFVTFAGVGAFLKDSITAAEDAGKAQRSLGQQLRVSGASLKAWRSTIDEADLRLAKFGVTSTAAEQSLTVLDRATGNIAVALKLQSVAVDIAKAKNIDLSQAALIVGKAYDGQLTSLRRLGVEIPKGATNMDALRIAGQKFAGQARANTTEMDRFHATLHDTEVIIGQALLPTVNKLLTSLSGWLDRMNRSGRLQKDVNGLVRTATGLFGDLKAIVEPLADAFKTLADNVGGVSNALRILVGVFAGFKAAKFAGELGLIGSSARTSAGEVAGLRAALGRLALVGAITIPIELLLNKNAIDKSVSGFLDKHGLPGGSNRLNPQQVIEQYGKLRATFGATTANKLLREAIREITQPFQNALNGISSAASGGSSSTGARVGGGATSTPFAGRGNPPAAAAAIKLPSSVSGSASGARLPNVSGQAFGVTRRFFGGLGLTRFGGTSFQGLAAHFNLPIQLQLEQAQAEALGNTAGVRQAITAERAAARRAIRSGKLSIDAQIEAWNFITQANSELVSQLSGFGPTGKVASSQALTSGIKFASVAARREQEARIAQLISHGGKLPVGQTVQGITVPVYLDGKKIAEVVTTHQNKQTRNRSGQTSGIHAGRQLP